MRTQPFFFPSPDGLKLEGLLHLPAQAEELPIRRPAVVLAHTHPQQPGGHMHARVIRIAAEQLAADGFVALRFNFRGVQASEGHFDDGRAELNDVRGAVAYLRAHAEVDPERVMLLGYSFGPRVVLSYATSDERIKAVLTIGFPARRFVDKQLHLPMPVMHLVGENDERTTPKLIAQFVSRHPTSALRIIPQADHFFRGHEGAVVTSAVKFFQHIQQSALLAD